MCSKNIETKNVLTKKNNLYFFFKIVFLGCKILISLSFPFVEVSLKHLFLYVMNLCRLISFNIFSSNSPLEFSV